MRLCTVFLLALVITLFSVVARSERSPRWDDAPMNVRHWFQELMQPEPNQYTSCCGEADAFEADLYTSIGANYDATITDGKGVWANGLHIFVPAGKVKWDQGNPTGHGILFLDTGGNVICYAPPGGV